MKDKRRKIERRVKMCLLHKPPEKSGQAPEKSGQALKGLNILA